MADEEEPMDEGPEAMEGPYSEGEEFSSDDVYQDADDELNEVIQPKLNGHQDVSDLDAPEEGIEKVSGNQGDPMSKCPHCDKEFNSDRGVSIHIGREHKDKDGGTEKAKTPKTIEQEITEIVGPLSPEDAEMLGPGSRTWASVCVLKRRQQRQQRRRGKPTRGRR